MILKNYRDTVAELNAATYRLKYLKDRKEQLLQMAFPKSTNYGNDVHGTGDGKSGQERYVMAITTPDDTGRSLDQKIEELEAEVAKLQSILNYMDGVLAKLDGIEYKLFEAIVVDGLQPSKAVVVIAERYYTSESNVWHNIYPKIKPYVQRIGGKDEG